MGTIASQITSLTIVYSTVYSDADQRKHQSSASLAFVPGIQRWPVNSQHKWPVMRKKFPLDDVIMFWASNHSPDRRLTARSHEISKPLDLVLNFSNSSEIWQVSRQYCYQDTSKTSQWYDHYNIQSHSFKTKFCGKTCYCLVTRSPDIVLGWRVPIQLFLFIDFHCYFKIIKILFTPWISCTVHLDHWFHWYKEMNQCAENWW